MSAPTSQPHTTAGHAATGTNTCALDPHTRGMPAPFHAPAQLALGRRPGVAATGGRPPGRRVRQAALVVQLLPPK
jgi:hypothetical protein